MIRPPQGASSTPENGSRTPWSHASRPTFLCPSAASSRDTASRRSLVEGVAASPVPLALFDPEDRLVYCSSGFATLYAVADGAQTFRASSATVTGRTGPADRTDDIRLWLRPPTGAAAPYLIGASRSIFATGAGSRRATSMATAVAAGRLSITAFKAKETTHHRRDAAQEEARTDDLTGIASPPRHHALSRYGGPRGNRSPSRSSISITSSRSTTRSATMRATDVAPSGRELAGAFRNTDRRTGGGEEFLLVMPGTHIEAGWRAISGSAATGCAPAAPAAPGR